MRKVFCLVCAGILIARISSVARAQDLSYGVKAGLNFANLTDAGEGESFKTKTGIALGGFAVYEIDDNLSIQPELLYTTEILVLAKYSISPCGDVCPFVFGGPALGILMSAKSDSVDIKSNCKSTELSLVLGGGVDYENYSVELRYNLGLTKVFNEGLKIIL